MLRYRPPGSAAFIFVFVTVALDMVALGIVVPVLPKLIIQVEHGNLASAATYSGIFATVWAAMQFFFSPVVGALSDRFGRRPIILLSNAGLALDYLVMALAPSLAWLFLGRVLSGITASSYATANSYIADVTPPEKRAARFGMLGAAFGLGFIIGPAFGGLLGGIDLRLPFWVAGALSLANTAYGYFILPESLKPENRRAFAWRRASPVGALRLLRSHPELLGLAAATVLMFLAHESLPNVFVLYTDYRYHWDATTVGLALACVGIGTTVVAALIVGPAVKRLGERRALLLGQTFGIIGFAIFAFAPEGWIYIVGIAPIALWGIASPALTSLMSRRVGADEQGRLQGAIASLRAITGMVGPLIFTQILALSIQGRYALPAGAAYLLAASLALLSLLLVLRVLGASATRRV
ncbi:MAG: TCR/Tet family MFS transporter [Steroidobacteraceae bacterium]